MTTTVQNGKVNTRALIQPLRYSLPVPNARLDTRRVRAILRRMPEPSREEVEIAALLYSVGE